MNNIKETISFKMILQMPNRVDSDINHKTMEGRQRKIVEKKEGDQMTFSSGE